MWLLHTEQTEGVKIVHCRNEREFKPPELPRISVDIYFPETNKIHEFFECFWHGDMCQPFRDVVTLNGDTLAEPYESARSRLEEITRAGS